MDKSFWDTIKRYQEVYKVPCVYTHTIQNIKSYKSMLKLDSNCQYGKIITIMYKQGERYYFCLKDNIISLMPADVVE